MAAYINRLFTIVNLNVCVEDNNLFKMPKEDDQSYNKKLNFFVTRDNMGQHLQHFSSNRLSKEAKRNGTKSDRADSSKTTTSHQRFYTNSPSTVNKPKLATYKTSNFYTKNENKCHSRRMRSISFQPPIAD